MAVQNNAKRSSGSAVVALFCYGNGINFFSPPIPAVELGSFEEFFDLGMIFPGGMVAELRPSG